MTVPMLQATHSLPPPRLKDKCAALVVTPLALLIASRKLIVADRVLRLVRSRVPTVPDVARAEELLAAFRWAAQLYPGRVACLEAAIGGALTGALLGAMPRFCIGAKFNPLQHHTWLEALTPTGELLPVAEPEAHNWPYKPALSI